MFPTFRLLGKRRKNQNLAEAQQHSYISSKLAPD